MVALLEADFSPNAVALFLALIQGGCIVVPMSSSSTAAKAEFAQIAQSEICFTVDANDTVELAKLPHIATHGLYRLLKESSHSGLVLFSSGSTGKKKAAVHDVANLLEKFKVPRHSLRTITFLLFDHIGGVNTMLYTLSNAGCIANDLDVGSICHFPCRLLRWDFHCKLWVTLLACSRRIFCPKSYRRILGAARQAKRYQRSGKRKSHRNANRTSPSALSLRSSKRPDVAEYAMIVAATTGYPMAWWWISTSSQSRSASVLKCQ